MMLPRVMLYIYFILQIIDVSVCDYSTSEDSSENTSDEELIDPHSIYYNRHRKEMQKRISDEKNENFPDAAITNSDSVATDSTECFDQSNCDNEKLQVCRDEKAQFELFYRRLVNFLLLQAVFEEEDRIVKGNFFMEATADQIQILREFGEGKDQSIRAVDSILSEIIRSPTTTFLEDAITYTELILLTINTHKYTCIGILIAVCILIVSRCIRWSSGMVIFFVLGLIFVISFFMTWHQLFKEAEIKQTAKQMMYAKMPIECQPEKMNLFQSIFSKLSFRGNSEECEKYIEAHAIHPIALVTPAQALSHLCTNFILQPVSLTGHSIASFVDNATGKMSWPMRWVVTLLLFIGVALLLVLLPFSYFGGSLGFGIGPLFHFTLNGAKERENKRLSNVQSRERIEMIREVPTHITIQRIESTPRKKEKSTKMLKSQLNEKVFKDKKALLRNSSDSDCFEKAKGDSTASNVSFDEVVSEQEFSDEEERMASTIQEIGSGDS